MEMVGADWIRSMHREDDLAGRPGSIVQVFITFLFFLCILSCSRHDKHLMQVPDKNFCSNVRLEVETNSFSSFTYK